ncbi:MAG: DNA-binding protein [Ferruginibacter sp.]|uniref:helix-turn-helix domain-containing protein n=1 Tax=Ferruginibacter sp. TaxID=1940288 RepID=UPI0026582477|nr:AraC family transcriptional regulator [Ferruginibacter sp.]MDB5277884.1 DNA-binding protein [Ferruginibacter sp.]
MSYHFQYTTLDASAIFKQLKSAYGINDTATRIDVPVALGGGFTQHLRLLSDIEILISEYDYVQDILFKHEAELTNNLVLWFDMAVTTGQQFSINNQRKTLDLPEQFNAYLLNSAFSFSQLRNKGTKGKSIMIFLPLALMEQLFNPVYLQEVLSNYYAVLCRGIAFAQLSASQEKKVNSIFYQWQKNKNMVSITKNIHQLVEWFFMTFFKKFADMDETVSGEETADLLAIEDALKLQVEYASPDIESLKKITALPFSQIENKFRKLHNKTLHQYFKEQKIQQGMLYLREGKQVSDVAFELGYANPSNFSSSFKKMYGLTADEFRKQFQND